MEEKVIILLQELIRNQCVNDGSLNSGQETRSAESICKFFKGYALEAEILEAVPGRGNLLARIPGTDPHAPSLMYMGHLDVVPANAELWSCNPFAADQRGGYIWGRGALDMLNITASMAVAFAELATQSERYPGDLIFLAEADEEASGRMGARWLVENHWDKVRTDYAITEGGGFFIRSPGRTGVSLTVGEKGLALSRLTTRGKAGHGSLPFKTDNAALKVAQAVGKLARYKPRVVFSAEYIATVHSLGLSWWQTRALLSPLLLSRALEALYKTDPGLAKQLHTVSRMTISPNVIQSGEKINIIPDHGYIDLDIRILPEQNPADVIREVSRVLGDMEPDFLFEITDFYPASVSSRHTPLYEATRELVGIVYPGKSFIPMLFSGATDARFWRMRGSTVYGFSLFDEEMTLSDYTRMLHGADERVSLKSLELTYNYFRKLPETFFRHVARQD